MPMESNRYQNSYDQVPYVSHSFPQSHPDRLATIARLFGLNSRPIDRARILELGCSSGGNLIPMAALLPQSRFVGIDLSGRQVETGQGIIRDLGLSNIRIQQASITDVDASWGEFDYILCHGVFSWVPEPVQAHIFRVCARNLAPDGVAYISYNTYPGWHRREAFRHMMLYHARQFSDPGQKVQQAKALLDFLARSLPEDHNPYGGPGFKNDVEAIKKGPSHYIFHEYLEDENQPLYFHQFAERAAAHQLKYLGEADLSLMLTSNFPKAVTETLNRISPNIIYTEQYMDFIRNRSFRQTLLCHKSRTLERNVRAQPIENLLVASGARPADNSEVDLNPGARQGFKSPKGTSIHTTSGLTKAALLVLRSHWPRAIGLETLFQEAMHRLGQARIQAPAQYSQQLLASEILRIYTVSMVELRTWQPDYVIAPGERPRAFALAAYQARQSPSVTNLRHEMITLDAFNRHLIGLLDGKRDRSALMAALIEMARSGRMSVRKKDEGAITDPDALGGILEKSLENALVKLARTALLQS